MQNFLVSNCEFVGLNLGPNFSVQCDTLCHNTNQSSFFSKGLGASRCVVYFYCGGDLVTARNLQKQERIRTKISNPFVFQQLTSSVVEGLEE